MNGEPADRSIGPNDAKFRRQRPPVVAAGGQLRHETRAVVRVDVTEPFGVGQSDRHPRKAEQGGEIGIELEPARAQLGLPNADPGRFQGEREPPVRFAQSRGVRGELSAEEASPITGLLCGSALQFGHSFLF